MTDSSKVKVMVVDDSAVIRGMMTQALQQHSSIEVVASAMNGKAALQELQRVTPHVILMDIEMPEMDGITALPLILKACPSTKVIMVSSLTQHGAEISMKALGLGAADCVGKPTSKGDRTVTDNFFRDMVARVIALGPKVTAASVAPKIMAAPAMANAAAASPAVSGMAASAVTFKPAAQVRCLAVGSSTGGPQALMQLFRLLKTTRFNIPIFVTQHMPATFTKILAEHLHTASGFPCAEAVDGEEAKSGKIYIAPGDYHMIPRAEGVAVKISLNQNPPVNFCRPAVDPMFEALAGIYGKHLLGVVLTGMGQDGAVGAKVINDKGGNVIAQDEATSVVWGMPGAVTKTGQAKIVLPLDEIAVAITRALS
jgi:two-component system chemotaxis response regulator CheB